MTEPAAISMTSVSVLLTKVRISGDDSRAKARIAPLGL